MTDDCKCSCDLDPFSCKAPVIPPEPQPVSPSDSDSDCEDEQDPIPVIIEHRYEPTGYDRLSVVKGFLAGVASLSTMTLYIILSI